jgi:hypothetical protein
MRLPACLLLLLLVGAGCAGYRLGPTGGYAASDRSIQVNPFFNQTLEPRLTDAVTQQLRKQLQNDGTFRLSTHGRADISVSGVITRYERVAMSFASGDVATGTDYRVGITAQVTAREITSGRTLLDRPVSGFTLVRVGNDLTSAERQALPLLAHDLARNITSLLADGSW